MSKPLGSKDAVTKLLVLRHGQSEWNAQGRWQGQADIELTDLGVDHGVTISFIPSHPPISLVQYGIGDRSSLLLVVVLVVSSSSYGNLTSSFQLCLDDMTFVQNGYVLHCIGRTGYI